MKWYQFSFTCDDARNDRYFDKTSFKYRKFAIGRPVQEVNVSIIDHGPNRLPDRL